MELFVLGAVVCLALGGWRLGLWLAEVAMSILGTSCLGYVVAFAIGLVALALLVAMGTV